MIEARAQSCGCGAWALGVAALLAGGCDLGGGKPLWGEPKQETSGGSVRRQPSARTFIPAEPIEQSEDIWAIRCIDFSGQDRTRAAAGYVDALREVEGLDPDLISVYEESGTTTIYYGRYKRSWNARENRDVFKPNHLDDLDTIRWLAFSGPDPATGGTKQYLPFARATMAALPAESRVPENWELSGASGTYSLQVGVFYDSEQMRSRRYAAEEYCKLLRDQGEEAYYHHGDTMSIVTIGSFPASAIEQRKREDALSGRVEFYNKIVDPGLLALQRKHPHNLHNGHKFVEVQRDPATGQVAREPDYSFVIEIPRGGGAVSGAARAFE